MPTVHRHPAHCFTSRLCTRNPLASTDINLSRSVRDISHLSGGCREGRGGEDGGNEEVAPSEEDVDGKDGNFSFFFFSRILLS